MADDITLTVRVRDMTRGDFDRLEGRLERLKRELQGVDRSTSSAGMHSKQLGKDVDDLGKRFEKMKNTGTLTRGELTRMRGSLDAMSRSALQAARSGEITADRFRGINNEVGRLRADLSHLDAGLTTTTNALRRNGNALNTNNNRIRTTIRQVNGLTQSIRQTTRSADGSTNVINTWRRDLDRLGTSTKSSGNQGTFFGKVFGNMRSKLIGTAVILGASLLPTIGALAPMLAGIGGIAGVAALAFSGLNKPTKQLSASQKEFIKGLKPLKKSFDELRKSAQDAVLPQLTKSFGDVKKVVKDLNPVVKIAGDAFGKLVGKIAKGISSKDFMGPFVQNVRMGTDWLTRFLGSFGKFAKAFFEFGTKSQPALDAWQSLLGGFLDRGLPGMFTNMESGIKGASLYLKGLASLINDGLLPGLGKLLGKFMEAFGPAFGDILREAGHYLSDVASDIGDVFVALAPVGRVLGHFASSLIDITRISIGTTFDTLKELGGGLLSTLVEAFSGDQVSSFTSDLTSLSTWVQNNEGPIRDAFTNIGQSTITMADAIIGSVPKILIAMRFLTEAVLNTLDSIISGMDIAFGMLPGIGPKIHSANKAFDEFHNTVRGTFDDAIAATQEFADKADANLSRAHLSLNVDSAKRNLQDIKERLQDPQLTKERKAKLTADMSDAQRKLDAAEAKLHAFDNKRADAKISANISQFAAAISWANRTNPKAKRVNIGANTSPFWRGVGGVVGRVLGTSYVDVAYRKVDSSLTTHGFATGGRVRRFANGGDASGPVSGPGTGMSDSVPALLSNGEYVIRASSVKKYGQGYMDALNGGTAAVKLASGGMASGGTTAKQRAAAAKKKAAAAASAEKAARNGAVGDLTISHFGRMAGYKNDEFRSALGKPSALGDLVGALNQWRSTILKATHGGVEKSLLRSLDKAGKSLIKYDKQLSTVNASLDKAKTNLDGLKQAAASLKESVTSNVMSATDITRVASSDTNVTMSDIMGGMRQSVDQSTAFSGALSQLKGRGVSGTVVSQIAEAGISGGGLQTATALLSASDSEISQINAMQKQINAAAGAAGKTASDAMYAAGIKAAQGLVDGLTKKQKSIENAMLKIATSMEKAIKKALGIHSPSRVMAKIGDHTAEGYAVGIRKNRSVGTAWMSMLDTGPASGGGSGGYSGGGGGGTYIFPVYVGTKQVDEVVLDASRRTVRTRGGDVQTVFGYNKKKK